VQALARRAPSLSLPPGQVARRACAAVRHGTRAVLSRRAVVRGQGVAPAVGPPRTAAAMAAQIAAVVATAPTAPRWPCVGATRNRPCAAALVRLVAAHAGANGALGVNGQRGILQRLAPRVAVLRAPAHPSGLHATATPASWLNQVEIWLGILTKKVLRRGKFTSVEDLTAQVRAFVVYDNRTMAKPFTWTDAGMPLVA